MYKASFMAVMLLLVGEVVQMDATGGEGVSGGRKLEVATFAGGCFWCMQQPFDVLPGVVSTIAGYTGGHTKAPTYDAVSSGRTGHAEAVEIRYDPTVISYASLLAVFWKNIDPTALDRQFVDVGNQYRTAIFFHTEEQKAQALSSKTELERSGRFGSKAIVTQIVPASVFYPAEEYHQNYYKKQSARYKFYRFNSGRDQYLEKVWGKDGTH